MKCLMLSAAMAASAVTGVAPIAMTPAFAQHDRHDWRGGDRRWHGDRQDWDPRGDYRRGNYRARRMGRDDQIYRGRDNRYYCKRNDGTTGLVIGALGGGVAGNLLGGGTLGTLLGAGGGALLGREIDRGGVKCR
jgi:hypothetical protein